MSKQRAVQKQQAFEQNEADLEELLKSSSAMLVTSALNAEAQEKLAKGLSTDLSWGQSTIMDKLQSYLVVPEAQELFQTQLAPKLNVEQDPLIVFESSSIDTLAINRLQGTQAKVLFDQDFQRLAKDMGLPEAGTFVLLNDALQAMWKLEGGLYSNFSEMNDAKHQEIEKRSLALTLMLSTQEQYNAHVRVIQEYQRRLLRIAGELDDLVLRDRAHLMNDYLAILESLWQAKADQQTNGLAIDRLLLDQDLAEDVTMLFNESNFTAVYA